MKIVVDTSVWSLAFRRERPAGAPQPRMLGELISSGQAVYLLGVMFQELLQGIRDPKQFQNLKSLLAAFPLIEPTRNDYERAADLFTTCRHNDIQVGTVDCLIASIAIQNECYLFTADKDFQAIAGVSSLKLLERSA